ncbi:MAG: hypothetical protein AAGA77_26175, partial [Bacteroidota bacterium]
MMKILLSFLGVLLFYSSSIFAQRQITGFENLVPYVRFDHQGFVDINGTELLLESIDRSMRVSKITDSIELLYEVDFPFLDQIHILHGQTPNRSHYAVHDSLLFELFTDKIRVRNLLTSEYTDSYELEQELLDDLRQVRITNELIFLNRYTKPYQVVINRSTKKINAYSFRKKETYCTENFFFTKGSSFSSMRGITEHNLLQETEKVLFEDEFNFYTSVRNDIYGHKGIVFGGAESIRFYNEDTTFLLNCDFDFFLTDFQVYSTDQGYITILHEENLLTLEHIDSSDCSVLYRQEFHDQFNEENLFIPYHTPLMDNDLILFGYYEGPDAYLDLMLLDRSTGIFDTIDSPDCFSSFDPTTFFKNENYLYFVGYDAGDYPEYPVIAQWYSIDLNTFAMQYEPGLSDLGTPIAVGSSTRDKTYLLTNQNSTLKLYDLVSGTNFTLIDKIQDSRNFGIESIRYLANQDEHLVFKHKDDIYLVDNNDNEQLHHLFNADEISNLAPIGNSFQGLVNDDSTTYYLNINADNPSFLKVALDQYQWLNDRAVVVSNYIFGDFTIYGKRYFDISEQSIMPIPISEDIISFLPSHEKVLLLTECPEGYCLYSFEDGTTTKLSPSFNSKPEIFSKNDGQFFIVEPNSSTTNKVYFINGNGSLEDEIEVKGNLKVTATDGPLSVFMFFDAQTSSMEIILHRYSKFHSNEIPYSISEVETIKWYKAGDNVLIKTKDVEDDGIYICSLGKEAKLLNNEVIDLSKVDLLFASESENTLSILTSNYGETFILTYDLLTQTFTDISSHPRVDYSFDQINQGFKIAPNEYVLTFTNLFEWLTSENSE